MHGELAALLAALLDRLRKFENSGLGVRAARPEEPSSTSCVRHGMIRMNVNSL